MDERIFKSWVLEMAATGWLVYQGHMGDRFVKDMHAFSSLDDALHFIEGRARDAKKNEH